jgi:hypothetical protein
MKTSSLSLKIFVLIFAVLFITLSCSSEIPVDEEKIHEKIKTFYLEIINDPSTFKIISYSKANTVFKSENQIKLKMKVVYEHKGEARTGDFDITVTKDEIILLPTKEYEKFLRD